MAKKPYRNPRRERLADQVDPSTAAVVDEPDPRVDTTTLKGHDLQQEAALQERRSFETRSAEIQKSGLVREVQMQTLRLARPGSRVPDGFGGVYPDGEFQMPAGNLYAARRIRDGSLVSVTDANRIAPPAPVTAPEPEPVDEQPTPIDGSEVRPA